MSRNVFFISDGTGITAESFGQSLLAQFEEMSFEHTTLPYINTVRKAKEALFLIKEQAVAPIIFMTVVNDEVRLILHNSSAYTVDLFATFMPGLEKEIGQHPLNLIGRKRSTSSSQTTSQTYLRRIEAIQFALDNDDGIRTRYYDKADIILLGASRSGKTPTCIYLGLQFGIFSANYPITEEDFEEGMHLSKSLIPYRVKLFGLTIDPDRLAGIRNERMPDSRYASSQQCQYEIDSIERLYQQESVEYINTTDYSIEEIATRIMALAKLNRRVK